jgi:ribosome-binding factor A
MSIRRLERVNDLLREVVAEVVARELKDPRLEGGLVSITEVRTARDFSRARVFVSVLGDEAVQASALAALRGSSGFIWRTIRPRLKLRTIPQLDFQADDRIAEDRRIQDLIDALAEPEPPSSETPPP